MINSRPEYQAYRIDNMADVPPELAEAAVDGAVPIDRTGFFFYVYCKDDSRLYEEWVPYDPEPIRARLSMLGEAFKRVKEAIPTSEVGLGASTAKDTLVEVTRDYQEVPLTNDGKLHWKCTR